MVLANTCLVLIEYEYEYEYDYEYEYEYKYERSSRRRYLTFVAMALSNVRRDGVI